MALIVALSGCAAGDERFRADICQSKLEETADVGGRVNASCDFNKPTWLLAIPQPELSTEAFTSAGMPAYVARALSQRTRSRSEWCIVDVHADGPQQSRASSNPDFDIECGDSRIEIPELTVLYGTRFSLRGNRGKDGKVSLVGIDHAE